jgi:hypothetical protein
MGSRSEDHRHLVSGAHVTQFLTFERIHFGLLLWLTSLIGWRECGTHSRQGISPTQRSDFYLACNKAIANLTGAIAAAPRRPSSPGPSCTATSICSVHQAGTLSRRDRGPAPPPAPVACAGYRVSRRHPLTEAALYNDDARPLVLAVPKPHHVCSICWATKSHPVS